MLFGLSYVPCPWHCETFFCVVCRIFSCFKRQCFRNKVGDILFLFNVIKFIIIGIGMPKTFGDNLLDCYVHVRCEKVAGGTCKYTSEMSMHSALGGSSFTKYMVATCLTGCVNNAYLLYVDSDSVPSMHTTF